MTPPIIPPVHRDGWKFVAAFAVVTLVLFAVWRPLGWAGVMATLWCLWFFRDPPRVTPLRAGLVISPADGVVVAIREAAPPLDLGMGPAPMRRISIFLNIFDVHINRAPVAGRVIAKAYHPGRFLNASLDKASDENERSGLRLAMDNGTEIAVVQIAGLIARRILCWAGEGDALAAGQRFGLIRFGSRTDLYLPLDWSVTAIEGQRVLGGETILADALSSEPQRLGAVR